MLAQWSSESPALSPPPTPLSLCSRIRANHPHVDGFQLWQPSSTLAVAIGLLAFEEYFSSQDELSPLPSFAKGTLVPSLLGVQANMYEGRKFICPQQPTRLDE